MRQLLIAGALVLTSTSVVPAQTPLAPVSSNPIHLNFIQSAPLGEALSVIGRLAGITLEFDKTVTDEMQRAPLAKPMRMEGVTVEQAISVMTSTNGLSYTIIGPKTVRISKKV